MVVAGGPLLIGGAADGMRRYVWMSSLRHMAHDHARGHGKGVERGGGWRTKQGRWLRWVNGYGARAMRHR